MKNSTISWTHHTLNFWSGCSGKNCEIRADCYAAAMAKQYGWNFNRVRLTSDGCWSDPLRWNEEARREKKSYRVFVSSLADFFDDQADTLRPRAWDLIRQCRHLTWMILTKRPLDVPKRLPPDWEKGYKNVWLGTTITSAETMKRLGQLSQVPAFRRFISAEPLIGPLIDMPLSKFHLMIVGGMSGPNWKKYEMNIEWAKRAQEVAKRNKIAFFFKQVSARKDGQRPDALGRIYNELPSGLYPWMPMTASEIEIPAEFLRVPPSEAGAFGERSVPAVSERTDLL